MKNVSKEKISAELTRLNLVLNAKRSIEEIRLLTDIWFVDCQHMLENRFVEAVAACRKSSKWFPTPHDIITEYNSIVKQVPQDVPKIPFFDMTEEQAAENRKWIREHLKMKGLGSRNTYRNLPKRYDRKAHEEKVLKQKDAILSGKANP